MAKKKKRKKNTSKDLLYPNTLSHTSPKNLHHTYLAQAGLIRVDRENNELMHALGNPEHIGQT
jgi:hypothetical protein